ncbi:MAG TPA: hypothetical protein VM406_06010 [Noviherbaspirillum sp.]|nr:hypothetical protein [Noviherbaspirillum sp.]
MSRRTSPARSAARAVSIALIVAALSACAVWTRIDTATQEGPGNRYSVQAPIGWVRFSAAQDGIVITRDGMQIQHIVVMQKKDEEFFKKTKAKLPKAVMPSDLAQLVLAELRSDPELSDLEVKEIAPYSIGAQAGFRVHLQFRNGRGALFDRVLIGAAREQTLTLMSYHALNTHYFARDVETFYKVASSFKAT